MEKYSKKAIIHGGFNLKYSPEINQFKKTEEDLTNTKEDLENTKEEFVKKTNEYDEIIKQRKKGPIINVKKGSF